MDLGLGDGRVDRGIDACPRIVTTVRPRCTAGTLQAQGQPKRRRRRHGVLTPTCGCCGNWTDHLKRAGFAVTREVTSQLDAVPARRRVPDSLRSCHTAVIGNYLVEGHVPADLVQKLLKERPKIAGIAVPGMPAGSPGMESNYPVPYLIVAFRADGTTYEFAKRHSGATPGIALPLRRREVADVFPAEPSIASRGEPL